jgi:cytochrome oxidase assembly protein ShyY1
MAVLSALLVAFVALGMWQWGRAHRTHRLSPEALAQRSVPVPVDTLLTGGNIAAGDSVGRAVEVSGVFDGGHQLLVPDRVLGGATGYLVIAPLRTAHGTVVVGRDVPARRAVRSP